MVNSVRVNLKNAQVFHRIYLHFEDLGELSGLYMKILKYAEKMLSKLFNGDSKFILLIS